MSFPNFFFAAVLLFHVCLLFGSDQPSQGLTAQERLDRAGKDFLEGKSAEAAAGYAKFESDFGRSKEGVDLLRTIRFRQAMCLVQTHRLAEAQAAINAGLDARPPLPASEVHELQFWLGVAQLEGKDFRAARESFEKFIAIVPPDAGRTASSMKAFPAAGRISEARLLIGSAWMEEGKFREAAEYFSTIKPGLTPENRGRAVIQHFRALMESGDNDAAMQIAAEEFPHVAAIIPLLTFQTLVLDLGSRWLEKGELRKAIACFLRIWPSDRLLNRQRSRLDELQRSLQIAEANPSGDPAARFLFAQLVQNVKSEIESFKKIPSFDAAVRFRLAGAYLGMKRYREAALIMEDLLARLPPDPAAEQATVNLVHCWNEIDRPAKAIDAARAFVKKLPQSASVPLVLYLEGTAQQNDSRFDEAIATFAQIVSDFPSSEFAPRALFMKGFAALLSERYNEAGTTFLQMDEKFSAHDLADAAAYWCGMASSLDRKFEPARNLMGEYLKAHKAGRFRGSAAYRHAYCTQQLEDYEGSIKELSDYLRSYPGHEDNSEARLLLGDALMNQGRMEQGISSFAALPKSAGRIYEEGVFKTGKAYQLMEEYGKLRNLMSAFQAENPHSPRIAEAICNAGRVFRQEGHPEKARELYWDAINKYGNDPDVRSVEKLFPALAKLSKGPEDSAQYLARLRELASGLGRRTLALRALWAQSLSLKACAPDRSCELLVEAAALADVQATSPLILADCADALIASGRENDGGQMLRDLVKWNPRAAEKDRALGGLGLLEMKRGNDHEALALFERFEKETVGSRISGRILLAKSVLFERRGQRLEVRKALESLLANQYATGKEKAEALYRIGDSHMADGNPALAVPYFQRIYVMHGRWRDWVAKAYLRSGEAFEKLDDQLSARRTYQELGANNGLTEFPEFARALVRLAALGGPILDPDPTKG